MTRLTDSVDYFTFLNKIIGDGIDGVKKTYKNNQNKLDASIAGFEACRGKQPLELKEVLSECDKYVKDEMIAHNDPNTYWWFRHYQLQAEWVCNVVSAYLIEQGTLPILNTLPTVRGVMKAREILLTGK